jgi:hypothetical protein
MEAKKYDSKGRRYRFNDEPIGQQIHITPRDLIVLESVATHGTLTSEAIRQLTPQYHPKSTTARLRLLSSETTTKHKGKYLRKPPQQWLGFEPNKNNLIYTLNREIARKALKEYELWSDNMPTLGNAWRHDCAVGIVTSSIEIAAKKTDHIKFIPGHKILDRAETSLRYMSKINGKEIALLPDAIFGLEFFVDGVRKTRLYCLELDRGTEQKTGVMDDKKSHERNVLQYEQFIRDGGYQELLNIPANTGISMMVLYVTTTEKNKLSLMNPTDNNYSLHAHVDDFGAFFKPISPLDRLFADPYMRHNREPFYINTP